MFQMEFNAIEGAKQTSREDMPIEMNGRRYVVEVDDDDDDESAKTSFWESPVYT
jgi:hypothetical protein